MKKCLLTLLAILTVLSMMAVTVSATADGGSAAVSSGAADPGEFVYLTVSLSDVPAATSIGVSVKNLPVAAADWLPNGKMEEFILADNMGAWTTDRAVDVNGEILDLVFVVPEGSANQRQFPVEVTVQVMNGSVLLGTYTATGKVLHRIPATGISLNKTALTLDLSQSKTATLTATLTPADSTDKVVWTSDNEAVSTVKDGVVTGLKAGTATITATTGTVSKSCSVTVSCSHKNPEKISASAASCTATGTKEHWLCHGCNQLLSADKKTVLSPEDVIIPKQAHSFKDQWESSDTQHWRLCDACGALEAAANHEYKWVIDKIATADQTGLQHEECVCGRTRGDQVVIDKLAHAHTGITKHEKVNATCVKTGTAAYWTCSAEECAGKYYADAACKTVLSSVVLPVDPNNHAGETVVKDYIAPGCESKGFSGDTYCAGCDGLIEAGSSLDATGHSFKWVIDKYPTEWSEGIKHEQCASCKQERNHNTVISKLIHNPKRVDGKEPTCLEEGVKEHFYCANCGLYYAVENGVIGAEIQKDDTVLAATGHQFSEDTWEYDEENHWHACACGEPSEKEAHTLSLTGAVEATETAEGYTGDEICSVCQYVAKQGEVIPMAGAEEETTEAAIEDTEPEEVKDGSPAGIIAIIVAAVVVCGGAVLLILKKRKK